MTLIVSTAVRLNPLLMAARPPENLGAIATLEPRAYQLTPTQGLKGVGALLGRLLARSARTHVFDYYGHRIAIDWSARHLYVDGKSLPVPDLFWPIAQYLPKDPDAIEYLYDYAQHGFLSALLFLVGTDTRHYLVRARVAPTSTARSRAQDTLVKLAGLNHEGAQYDLASLAVTQQSARDQIAQLAAKGFEASIRLARDLGISVTSDSPEEVAEEPTPLPKKDDKTFDELVAAATLETSAIFALRDMIEIDLYAGDDQARQAVRALRTIDMSQLYRASVKKDLAITALRIALQYNNPSAEPALRAVSAWDEPRSGDWDTFETLVAVAPEDPRAIFRLRQQLEDCPPALLKSKIIAAFREIDITRWYQVAPNRLEALYALFIVYRYDHPDAGRVLAEIDLNVALEELEENLLRRTGQDDYYCTRRLLYKLHRLANPHVIPFLMALVSRSPQQVRILDSYRDDIRVRRFLADFDVDDLVARRGLDDLIYLASLEDPPNLKAREAITRFDLSFDLDRIRRNRDSGGFQWASEARAMASLATLAQWGHRGALEWLVQDSVGASSVEMGHRASEWWGIRGGVRFLHTTGVNRGLNQLQLRGALVDFTKPPPSPQRLFIEGENTKLPRLSSSSKGRSSLD